MELFSWGNNDFGQLAQSLSNDSMEDNDCLLPSSSDYEFNDEFVEAIACGWKHTVFLLRSGLILSCGSNSCGQLGLDESHDRNLFIPEVIKSLETEKIIHVACGESFTVAVNNRGDVFAWGGNDQGQLGIATTNASQTIPRRVKGISSGVSIASVSCGQEHSVALSTEGQVFAWGRNDHGQIGIGRTTEKVVSKAAHLTSMAGYPVSHVACGGNHSMLLTISGSVFAWGKNSSGQLGIAHNNDQFLPEQLLHSYSPLQKRVKYIVCGEGHSVFLTSCGSVMTFGCGFTGQLGHGSYENECIPREVQDLPRIRQIACGRKHTMCMGDSDVFVFGLNIKGQLGIGSYQKINKPVKIASFWNPYNSNTITNNLLLKLRFYENVFVRRNAALGNMFVPTSSFRDANRLPIVYDIFAGGLQSFLITFKQKCYTLPINKRDVRSESLFYLTVDRVEDALKTDDLAELKRFEDQLSRIFCNASCLNGSFLDNLTYDGMIEANMHGVRLMAVHRSCILLLAHERLKPIIVDALREKLLPSLKDLCADAECLRVYIIIPEILSACSSRKHRCDIVYLFAKAVLRLSEPARNTLESWWSSYPSTFFERCLECFKVGVTDSLPYLMRRINTEHMLEAIESCLIIMKRLFEINEKMEEVVAHSSFYIVDAMESIDVRNDFRIWSEHPEYFSFTKYPFIYDAKVKSVIMDLDTKLQMRTMMDKALISNLEGYFSGSLDVPHSPYLILNVRREFIVRDTLNCIWTFNNYDLKKPLRVKFYKEEGEDAGGVRKEFFLLLMKELLNLQYGMFDFFNDTRVMWFKPNSFETPEMFQLIGLICGLAIYNSVIIDLPFPVTLYRKLLHKETGLSDLMEMQPTLARSLQYMLDYTDSDFDEVFDLHFQIEEQVFGDLRTIDLIENGANVRVTQDNKSDYVERYVNYKIHSSVEDQFQPFANGFESICDGKVFQFFHPRELMDLIVGCNEYEFSELEKIAEYKGEYHKDHPVITLFWNAFWSFDLKTKKKFLAFLTGSDRVSILGMEHMKFYIKSTPVGENHLPVAHTCFNILVLPSYSTLDLMAIKLRQAIENSEGFGLA